MNAIDLEIRPYVGVGALLLGMSADGVEGVLGAPRHERKSQEERTFDYFPGPLCTFEGAADAERLVEVGFTRECRQLSYRGVALFSGSRRAVLRHLARDDSPLEYVGFLVFLQLGITLTGFHDGAEEDLAVTVFERGRWDDVLPRMRPFSLKR